MAQNFTGYGSPMHAVHARHGLIFDGDETKWETWECKFLAHMKIKKLKKFILPGEPASADKREDAFAELVQCLDERSIQLIMRDAKDDGRKAFEILRHHYAGRGTQRVISQFMQLSLLKKQQYEPFTDYMLRAEAASTALKSAGQVFPDTLLIAMVLKGLPPSYKPFTVVITQSDKELTFTDFKMAIRNFEENERSADEMTNKMSVMKLQNYDGRQQHNNDGSHVHRNNTNNNGP